MTKKVLITGSSGLIGSEAVLYFDSKGWSVHGIDNNMRREFFGPDGDTSWNLERLKKGTKHFTHHSLDIRNRIGVFEIIKEVQPDCIIHCAAQPSHDLAKDRPFDDFEVNAVATLNMLEATRQHCPESPFIFMSTNKVYGDAPNEIPRVELETRYDYERAEDYDGVPETCRVDACLHSLFGASKLAADIMVQEYGRYFDMPTVCFRGGCLTGPNHSGAEMHGFLSYLAKAVREGRKYRIYGYKGKQVRDNIHSFDVCEAFYQFYENPRKASVYNLGGGRENSVSMLEAIAQFEALYDKKLDWEYIDQNRTGDHICYISNLTRFKQDYPKWKQSRTLAATLAEIAGINKVAF
ncbi:MAG: NAD-dependent epimerase/dehydratase family protein [Verrucomicrobiota bacterium]|nr:NAD-dependent epimerase/dehydratase family protein [Verrucomicrobiota bacterium]